MRSACLILLSAMTLVCGCQRPVIVPTDSTGGAERTSAAQRPARDQLGRNIKLRILVDKVMQPVANWTTEEWMVRATAEAGFNVYCPRRGHDDPAAVWQVTLWCAQQGLYHMPWMRGSLAAPKGTSADGKRLVWASGAEQPLWSPNSDEFWEWTTRHVVGYARIAAENDSMMGVFLDYENYTSGRKEGNLYFLSYDDVVLDKFAAAQGVHLPALGLSERRAWLEVRGLHEAFAAFQIRHWRSRCRQLREAVDRFSPSFQFCIYPAPGTPFIVEAVYPEWATEQAPLILADASVYGRPGRLATHEEGLQGNREKLLTRMQVPRNAGIPFFYAGGIDPTVHGADPEFSGKNAVMISQATDGYWIFYEGVDYASPEQKQYDGWFAWANRQIAAGRLEAWREPRQTPENWSLDALVERGRRLPVAPPTVTGKHAAYPVVRLRDDNLALLGCEAGRPVRVTLQHQPVARYADRMVWQLHDPDMKQIASGEIPYGGRKTIAFTPQRDGVYLLGAAAGYCAWSVREANVPVGLYAGIPLKTIYGAEQLFFRVPEGTRTFALAASGTGRETIRLSVFGPDGKQVATAQTTPDRALAQLRVKAGGGTGQTWSLRLGRADQGVLEDATIKLGPELPPVLSLIPAEAFRLKARD